MPKKSGSVRRTVLSSASDIRYPPRMPPTPATSTTTTFLSGFRLAADPQIEPPDAEVSEIKSALVGRGHAVLREKTKPENFGRMGEPDVAAMCGTLVFLHTGTDFPEGSAFDPFDRACELRSFRVRLGGLMSGILPENPPVTGIWVNDDGSVTNSRPPTTNTTRCDHHDDHDGTEPAGVRCFRPATRIITWPDSKQISMACHEHALPEAFDPDAPPHHVSPWLDAV